MSWRRYFPDYRVPSKILALVDSGALEDASKPDDPAPSFVFKSVKKGWFRIWVEHPDPGLRRAGPYRYRVETTEDLGAEGRLLVQDDVLSVVWPTLMVNFHLSSVKKRWRLLGAEKKYSQAFDFGDLHIEVSQSGTLSGWNYFRLKVSAPGIEPKFVTYAMAPTYYKEAAMGFVKELYTAFTNPADWIAGVVEFGGKRETALETVRLAESIGIEVLLPAYRQAMEEWFGESGIDPEEPRRSPTEWFPTA
jgi:hypothetical protein